IVLNYISSQIEMNNNTLHCLDHVVVAYGLQTIYIYIYIYIYMKIRHFLWFILHPLISNPFLYLCYS
ncbi:hypothetical protein K7X86_00435, partial [Candidatus Sulcia muelleri]|nr:hypothetical protein [Candidatus Karelsulcia muelleri]